MKKLRKISISELIKGYIFNSKTIQDKENNTYSASVIDEKIVDIDNKISTLGFNILYSNSSGIVATSAGNSVILNKSVTNFETVLIIHKKGLTVIGTQNGNNTGNGMNMCWYNNGLHGTFYENTVYAVIGLTKKQ